MKKENKLDRREAVRKMAKSMGLAVTAPSIIAFLQSCESTYDLKWQPKSFNENQAATLSRIADLILPETETLGALKAGVPQKIDGFLTEIMSEMSSKAFLSKMDFLIARCKETMGKTFLDCEKAEQIEFLTKLDQENKKGYPLVWGKDMVKSPPTNFFWQLKSMTIWMYTLNEEVGEQVLNYDPIPGENLSCVPLAEIGRVWSL